MIVSCTIENETTENDDGNEVETTSAHCQKCNHETTSFGTSEGTMTNGIAANDRPATG